MYRIYNKKKKSLLLTVALLLLNLFPLFAQQTSIRGKVINQDNQPLQGVSIIGNNGQSTTTDADGDFSISAAIGDVLTFSFVDYKSQDITVTKEQTFLNITLQQQVNLLNEVVLTALGISKEKKSLGYAVQEVKAKDLNEAPETNLVNSLAGRVAGVNITNSQGDMGSSRIIIRGETSIDGNNQPLFVVDGIPVDNSQFLGEGGSRDFANAIADINSEDIESISVLKGPNAAALYGSRAAAGVILITTKTGKNQKGLGVTINSNTTFSDVLILPKYQNTFGQGSNGEFSYVDGKGGGINDGVDESWGPAMDGRLIPQFFSDGEAVPFVPHPNNVHSYFRTGYTLKNGVAMTGSGDKYDFRFSYNNSKLKGIIPNSSLEKNSFSLNIGYDIAPKLHFRGMANYIRNDAPNLPGTGGKRITSTMLQFTWFGRQVDVAKLKDLYLNDHSTLNWNNSYYSNPYFVAYENTVSQRRDRILGSAELSYDIADGLTANFRVGNDYYTDRRKIRIAYGTNGAPFGSYEEDAYTLSETNTEGRLEYNKKVSKDFSIDVLAGGNIRSNSFEENDQKADKLAVSGLYTLNNSRDPLVSSNFFSRKKIYSLFGSAQVGYREWAYLNLTARNDWSSTLPLNHLSYFYPSINGSIILSRALNIENRNLNYLKLRGGWSKVGKDGDPYLLINTYDFTTPPFDGNPMQNTAKVKLDPNLKPETTTSTELGLESSLFDNVLHLDLSVYNTNSINQILEVDVSPSTGFEKKLINGGKINNRGIDAQLGLSLFRNREVNWDVNFNFSSNRSRVEELDKEAGLQSYLLGSDRTVDVIAAVGQPYGTLFGNAYLRNDAGEILVDAGGRPIIDPVRRYLGKFTPRWLGSIQNSVRYKQFNFGVLVDARVGGSIYSNSNRTGTYTGVLASTMPGRDAEHGGLAYYYPDDNHSNDAQLLENGSQSPNGETVYHDGNIFPGVTQDGKENNVILPAQEYYKSFTNVDEQFIYSASFVKLREIRIGYTLPAHWVGRLGFQSATLSFVGRNLWIIYKDVPNVDPETAFNTGNAQGLEDLTNPTVRNFGFNINLKF